MAHGRKSLLRVSSVKLARSPIQTSESRFLSRCWVKPIIISLHSRRDQLAMARQMELDIIAAETELMTTVTHGARVFSWGHSILSYLYPFTHFLLFCLCFVFHYEFSLGRHSLSRSQLYTLLYFASRRLYFYTQP